MNKYCSYCDFSPCKCNEDEAKLKRMLERQRELLEAPTKKTLITRIQEDENARWMSKAEADFQQAWYKEREQMALREMGLGWIADFCSKLYKENGELDKGV
jgi:hypothetical protein